MENNTVLIIAGGTGGHVMPALAVAEQLINKKLKVHWIGTQTGMEAKLVAAHQIPIEYIQIRHFRGQKGINKIINWFKAPFSIAKATIQAIRIIRRVNPQCVLSMGGYVAGPSSIAAWLCQYPLFIHEQNAIPGLTNRLLAPIASVIMTGFPKVFTRYTHKTQYTGNPVRANILAVNQLHQKIIQDTKHGRAVHILILGGSLGAGALNEIIPQVLQELESKCNEALIPSIEIWHQTGEKQFEHTRKIYKNYKIDLQATVTPFIEDMAKAYAWADLVICRAGALTIAELTAAGCPSILVPFPAAADDHQTKNAQYLTDNGAAILVPQSQLSFNYLSNLLIKLLQDLTQLKKMGQRLII